jgi:ZIP family zinc transporter
MYPGQTVVDQIVLGTLGSFVAGLATVLGAFPTLFVRRISERALDTCLGVSAGIMLAATSFSLLVPAIRIGGIWRAVAGLLLGTLFLIMVEKLTPHVHRVSGIRGIPTHLSKMWLFILAITIHNFPEGITVGVGFGGGDLAHGIELMVGMALQNIPEGLAVALPMMRENMSVKSIFLVTLLTGIVEPFGGFIGISTVTLSRIVLPYAMAFSAGAMLFIISEEIIPETHSRGNDRQATIGLIFGFVLMMILDNLFG